MAASWSAKEAAVWPLYLGGNVFKEFSTFVRYQLKINSHSEKFCWLPLGICQRCAVRPTPTKLSIEQSAKKGHNSQIGGGPHILKTRVGSVPAFIGKGAANFNLPKAHHPKQWRTKKRRGAPLWVYHRGQKGIVFVFPSSPLPWLLGFFPTSRFVPPNRKGCGTNQDWAPISRGPIGFLYSNYKLDPKVSWGV